MIKPVLLLCSALAAGSGANSIPAADQPSVRVEPTHLQGPRVLQEQTQSAVIRDYLESWQSLSGALDQNRADLLERDFVGTAHDKLAETIQEQTAMGIHTHYQDRAHDVQIVFYSPDGLSVQLIDNVDYDEQIVDHDKVQTSQRLHARYVVVLTPSEVRWRVRIFQSEP